jgi:NAD(P)-dependent dehydrogenase (short-subunit alcohol dehydrogenase family)
MNDDKDLFGIEGQVVLITGASSGIGAHFSKLLAQLGATVVLAARRLDKLQALQHTIEGNGGRAFAVQMDVTDAASIKAAITCTIEKCGKIDTLVNNAYVLARTVPSAPRHQMRNSASSSGVLVDSKLSHKHSNEDWDSVLGVSRRSAILALTVDWRRIRADQPDWSVDGGERSCQTMDVPKRWRQHCHGRFHHSHATRGRLDRISGCQGRA